MKLKLNILLIIVLTITPTMAMEVHVLQSFKRFFDLIIPKFNSTKDISQMTLAELGQSQGECEYNFLDYITYRFDRECALDEKTIAHLPKKSLRTATKPPITVKCIQTNVPSEGGVTLLETVADVIAILKPIGNATKRNEKGSCVLLYFYTDSSVISSYSTVLVNYIPTIFPMLRVGGIDAYKLPNFNTEFGIFGLPTLLLFHQGRLITRHIEPPHAIIDFITRHTDLKPIEVPRQSYVEPPLPYVPVERVDYCLILSWAFILLCAGNYFAKSRMCQQIIEMVKRNWRESEAQLEHT